MGQIIEFQSNGGTASGYLAEPPTGSGIPLVVIQEWWGLVPHITDVCDRFAAEGFLALAPDLYHGETTTEPDEAGKLMMALNMAQAAKDLSGAVDEVSDPVLRPRRRHHRLLHGRRPRPRRRDAAPRQDQGVRALVRPDPLARCAAALGPARGSGARALRRERRVLHAGRGQRARVRPPVPGKEVQIVIHPGVDHAFFNDTRPEVYDAAAAMAAWQQTVGFLRTELA